MVVVNPGMKPCSLRVDQLDRDCDQDTSKNIKTEEESSKEEKGEDSNESRKSEEKVKETPKDKRYPEIVHFGIRPPQLSYAGNPE